MPVDQGFRYELCAMIAAPDVLEPMAAARPQAQVIGLAQGLAMVPVTSRLSTALEGTGATVPPETGFWLLSPGVLHLLETASAAGPIAYIETDYLGRDGRQTAAIWERGDLLYGPSILDRSEPFPRDGSSPIGTVLRRMGVVAAGRHDEFVVLGLGRHRSTEQWS